MSHRHTLSMIHSNPKLSKTNHTPWIGRLNNVSNQSKHGKGVTLSGSKTVSKDENEAVRGNFSSLHDMVNFITIGTDATEKPHVTSKPSGVPVESVADQFVKLTSKVPGRPPFQSAVPEKRNSSFDQSVTVNSRKSSFVTNGGKSDEEDREKMTVDNNSISRLDQKQILLADNDQQPRGNGTFKLRIKLGPTLTNRRTSPTIFRHKPTTKTKLEAMYSENEETTGEVDRNLPNIVEQLENIAYNDTFEGSGEEKEIESEENSPNIDTKDTKETRLVNEEDIAIQRFPGLSWLEEDSGCTNSEIMKNVTLRGGINSGKFKDRGWMDDFRLCIKLCCLTKLCDLAFMLRNNCFTVECKSEELCEAVPVKTSAEKPPLLAYIYARSLPFAKRN